MCWSPHRAGPAAAEAVDEAALGAASEPSVFFFADGLALIALDDAFDRDRAARTMGMGPVGR